VWGRILGQKLLADKQTHPREAVLGDNGEVSSVPPPSDQARQRLAAEIAAIASAGALLPGSVVMRSMACNTPGCHCHGDPPQLHGPYAQWTRKVGGRTRTRNLSREQLARYGAWFDNARRLRDAVAELEALCLHAASEAEGWSEER
jgi:hypothetical protein